MFGRPQFNKEDPPEEIAQREGEPFHGGQSFNKFDESAFAD